MAILQNILSHPAIWRGSDLAPAEPGIETGHVRLDSVLPGGGWPRGALTEIVAPREGAGELSLLLPALARLSRAGKWIAFVAPPYIPYAPALARAGIDLSRYLLVRARSPEGKRWAVEQALRSGTCGAVLFWPGAMDDRHWRRLQLAAEEGESLGFSFNTRAGEVQRNPAALRLRVTPDQDRLRVEILKRRGGGVAAPLSIALTGGLEQAAIRDDPPPGFPPRRGAQIVPRTPPRPATAAMPAPSVPGAVWERALARGDEARGNPLDPRSTPGRTTGAEPREAVTS